MSAGHERTRATFWLLDATDSLVEQSHANPDGTGLGWFDERGRPVVDKEPAPAFADARFARDARRVESRTMISHVRLSSGTARTAANTHPFQQDGRLFAHNGALGELERLEEHLGEEMAVVGGDTDSERYFALLSSQIRAADGDVRTGFERAVGWLARHVPVFSLNCVLSTPTELWALRYPETHELWLLERPAGGPSGDQHFHGRADAGTRLLAEDLASQPAVIVASERLDADPDWRLLPAGALLRVRADLGVTSTAVSPQAPRRRLAPPT